MSDRRSLNLADSFRAVLSLGSNSGIAATPAFSAWLPERREDSWPPDRNEMAEIWLIDTKDFPDVASLAREFGRAAAEKRLPAVVLLIGRRAGLKARLDAVARRLRGGRAQRLDIVTMESLLPPNAFSSIQRLYFHETGDVPEEFHFDAGHGGGGAGLLCCVQAPDLRPLWQQVRDRLEGAPDRFVFHELQLRSRGAAVALVGGQEQPLWAIRVVADRQTQLVVEKNHSAITDLHEVLPTSSFLREQIPAALFAFDFERNRIFGERFVPGTLAWRLTPGPLSGRILHESIQFLARLREETSDAREVSAATLNRLFAPDRAALARSDFVSDVVRLGLEREMDAAEAGLPGVIWHLHASHGDFGYGNILVDPTSGQLRGVIDWDTYRPRDLPGIDRVNFEIQRRRIENREKFSQAVAAVWREGRAHPALDIASPEAKATARLLFGAAVSRYVTRYLSYPHAYRSEAGEFEKTLISLGA